MNLINRPAPVCDSSALRQRLKADVADFVARGNEIKVIPFGQSADTETKLTKLVGSAAGSKVLTAERVRKIKHASRRQRTRRELLLHSQSRLPSNVGGCVMSQHKHNNFKPCVNCQASGQCPSCSGTGHHYPPHTCINKACETCEGDGKCEKCDGTGEN